MPLDLRSNPVTAAGEIRHPDLGTYFTGVVLLPTADGVLTQLNPAQASILNQILSNTQDLGGLLSIAQNLNSDSSNNTANLEELTAITVPSIASHTSDLLTVLNLLNQTITDDLLTSLENIRAAVLARSSTIPTIANLVLTNANTQYSFSFPANTTRYAFKCRNDDGDTTGKIRWSWAQNTVAPATGTGLPTGFYDVLSPGIEESEAVWWPSGQTVYFSTPTAGLTISLRYWTRGS